MDKLLGIAPFVILAFFATTANVSRFDPTLMPALVITALLAMAATQAALWRRDGAISAIGKGMLTYLVIDALGYSLFPASLGRILSVNLTGVFYLVLFCWVSLPALLTKSYFTEYFARKKLPPPVWESTPFKTINRNMTWVWAALFAIASLLSAIPIAAGWTGLGSGAPLVLRLVFQVLLPLSLILGVGVAFTRKYPAYYLRKLELEIPEGVPPSGEGAKVDGMVKIVAVNGSPKGAVGNTSLMVNMLGDALSGMGARLTEVFLSDKHIEYCVGCGHCLEKTRCWRSDDHAALVDELKGADGIILASPVYFGQVTAQMKAFIDRALSHGHKPVTNWKPGLAVSVSAGKGESETGRYLSRVLHPFGFFPVGILTAIATRPGDFTGKEHVRQRAADLARDLVTAIREKRRYPATDEDFGFYLFMRELVTDNRDFMTGDYEHWSNNGLLENFGAYIGQTSGKSSFDPAQRRAWIKEMVRAEAGGKSGHAKPEPARNANGAATCREMIASMPRGFHPEAAGDLGAVYQFEIRGSEEFDAYLEIREGACAFHEGRAARPDITIKAPSEVWFAISKGELNGQNAFMAGKFKVEGDMGLLMRMRTIFR